MWIESEKDTSRLNGPPILKIWPCPKRLKGAPKSVWEGPHINQRVQVRRLTSKQKGSKWKQVGTPTKRRNGKWERSQASGKAHNQVQNAKIQTPLLNPKEFSNTKTAAAVHSANNGENSTEFFCPQRGTTTLVRTPIERNWVFTSSSISTATHSATKVF